MKVFELIIDEEQNAIVNKVSLVDEPAVCVDFQAFNKNYIPQTLAKLDDEQRIVTGVALIPNTMIYRFDKKTNEPYYVYFSEDTIKSIQQIFFKNKFNTKINVDHKTDVDDVYIFESWTVLNPLNDKSNEMGINVPKGSLMLSMKIDNDEIWNEVKRGNLNGFSIEGLFYHKEQPLISSKENFDKKLISIEKFQFNEKADSCKLCKEISQRRNKNGGEWFIKGVLPNPPIHKDCKCKIIRKAVKDDPKNYK